MLVIADFIMAALRSRCELYIFALWFLLSFSLWPPYVIGHAIIFLPCGFFLLFSISYLFSSPNLSSSRSDVYHTSTHGVALLQI